MRAVPSLARTRLDEPVLLGLAGLLVVVALTVAADTPLVYLGAAIPLVVGLTWWRPVYGFALLLGLVLLSDQFEITTLAVGIEPFLLHILPMFQSLESFTPVNVKLTPVELWLLLVTAVWLAQAIATNRLRFRPIPCAAAALVAAAALTLTFVVGVMTDGDVSTAILEVRALAYLFGLAWLVAQLVERRQDLVVVLGVMVVALAAKALQGLYHYVFTLGMELGLQETFLAHEDPVMFVPLLFLAVALLHYRSASSLLRTGLLVAAPVMLTALVLTQRRAAYITLGLCAVVFAFVLTGPARRTYLRLALPVVVCCAVYLAAFAGSVGPLGQPIARTWSLLDDANTSNLYRLIELENLRYTIQTRPWGIGFGHPYEMLRTLPRIELEFEFYEYIPHNEILWIWVKAGTVGFIVVMFYFARLLAEAVWTYRHARDPLLRAVAAIVGLAIVNQLVASYFDLQLTYARSMIYLGTLIGLLGVIRDWSGLVRPGGGWRWRL